LSLAHPDINRKMMKIMKDNVIDDNPCLYQVMSLLRKIVVSQLASGSLYPWWRT